MQRGNTSRSLFSAMRRFIVGKSKRFTLKKRLPVYFGLLSIFSICVISFIAVNQATAVLEAQIHTNLTTIVEDQAKIFSEKYIASPRSNLETLAHCDTIIQFTVKTFP